MEKIRLGIIGANSKMGWAPRSHLPAVVASPQFELTAVCTTRKESAEETTRLYGAQLAFHDYHDLLSHPDIDAVAILLRVPLHFEPTRDAIEAGKHVYTEWPLGRTTAEAIELAAAAKEKGVKTAVGLQARVNPGLIYLKDLIASDYVGEVVSCRYSLVREGVLGRGSDRTWQRDVSFGASSLDIATGHSIDTLRFVAGELRSVSAQVMTQIPEWLETDTSKTLAVSAPDTITVQGRLEGGAAFSAFVASVPWAGNGYQLEIYGRKGTLTATSTESPQLNDLHLRGSQQSNSLEDLEVPERYVDVSDDTPKGSPFNVGQMYVQFGKSIQTGDGILPDFDTAVEVHRLLDSIQFASESGREVEV